MHTSSAQVHSAAPIGGTEASDADTSELYHVVFGPDDIREITVEQLDDFFRLGLVHARTRVWTEGMDGWQTLGEAAGLDAEADDAPTSEPHRPPPRRPPPSPRSRSASSHVPPASGTSGTRRAVALPPPPPPVSGAPRAPSNAPNDVGYSAVRPVVPSAPTASAPQRPGPSEFPGMNPRADTAPAPPPWAASPNNATPLRAIAAASVAPASTAPVAQVLAPAAMQSAPPATPAFAAPMAGPTALPSYPPAASSFPQMVPAASSFPPALSAASSFPPASTSAAVRQPNAVNPPSSMLVAPVAASSLSPAARETFDSAVFGNRKGRLRSRFQNGLLWGSALVGLMVTLYRNDILLQGAEAINQRTMFLELEKSWLGGAPAGTPRRLAAFSGSAATQPIATTNDKALDNAPLKPEAAVPNPTGVTPPKKEIPSSESAEQPAAESPPGTVDDPAKRANDAPTAQAALKTNTAPPRPQKTTISKSQQSKTTHQTSVPKTTKKATTKKAAVKAETESTPMPAPGTDDFLRMNMENAVKRAAAKPAKKKAGSSAYDPLNGDI